MSIGVGGGGEGTRQRRIKLRMSSNRSSKWDGAHYLTEFRDANPPISPIIGTKRPSKNLGGTIKFSDRGAQNLTDCCATNPPIIPPVRGARHPRI